MSIRNKTVSPTFRTRIKELIPQLGENPAYWNLFGILMFGMREDETGKTLIPRELLAICEGNEYLVDDKNYVAKDFLLEFKLNVNATLEWSNWSYQDKRCRVVTIIEWSPEVLQAVQDERNKVWEGSGRVFLSDGVKWSEYRQRTIRVITYAEVMRRMEKAEVDTAKNLISYVNTLPVLTFNRLKKNLPYAEQVARQQSDADNQLDLLRAIEDEYKPFYQPTKHSIRIFPFSENICCLQRDVRKALIQGWTEFDLKSAQLAIAAKLWNLPEVSKYLEEGRSIWADLYTTFGIEKEKNPRAKDYFKEALYAVMYGASKTKVAQILSPLQQNAFDLFISNYIIRIMWNAREEQLKRINLNKGMEDCYGRWLELKKESSCRSILAQVSQAMELLLLSGVVELAIQEKHTQSFTITLWQHDGFAVQFRREAQKEYWQKRITEVVADKAQELGVPTTLEVTKLAIKTKAS